MEEYQLTNVRRMICSLSTRFNIKGKLSIDDQKAIVILKHLPLEHQLILIYKWGLLPGTTTCFKMVQLATKANEIQAKQGTNIRFDKYSIRAYMSYVEDEFVQCRYAFVLKDCEAYKDFPEAARMGHLLAAIFGIY